MRPKGSYKGIDGRWWVACLECIRGINGEQSCNAGVFAKNFKVGCFCGKLLERSNKE